jgi:hypothetical protein
MRGGGLGTAVAACLLSLARGACRRSSCNLRDDKGRRGAARWRTTHVNSDAAGTTDGRFTLDLQGAEASGVWWRPTRRTQPTVLAGGAPVTRAAQGEARRNPVEIRACEI